MLCLCKNIAVYRIMFRGDNCTFDVVSENYNCRESVLNEII